jgi:hypothetical protein
MGTGAVYVTMSGLKNHSSALTGVETFFFFLNIALFLLNTSTLLIQAIGVPRMCCLVLAVVLTRVQCTRASRSAS